ncbi:MAG: RHS repeat-associated core domain-containing protein, partial [Candidatus Acidiferrales bacterium]
MPKDRPPAFSQSVTSTNQVSGFTYDVAGNLAGIPGGGSYTYDAENHLTSAAGVAYTYDGDGERVEKSNGEIYWYTSGGEVLDETDLSGNLTSEYIFFGGARIARRDGSGNVFYYLTDHLGSSREIVEAGQTTACYDADFYPFGGERAYTNTCQQNYKFTGKERDPESGLDDFEARYYGSSIARFTSPDDPFVGWQLNDPQSLNLYAYVQDNPINDVDPTGHCLIVNGGSVMQCGFSELEAAMNTMTIEGWNYTGIGVP